LALETHLTLTGMNRLGSEIGLRDLQAGDGACGDAAGHEIQTAVQQLQSVERRGIGDARDALDGRIDLKLVGRISVEDSAPLLAD
jgi:hypothetical protein